MTLSLLQSARHGRALLLTVLLLLDLLHSSTASTTGRPNERLIQIRNQSRSKMEVYWINPHTREAVLMSDPFIAPGADFVLNSFIGHEFEARESKNSQGVCKYSPDKKCRSEYLVVSENDNQVMEITPDWKLVFVDDHVKAHQQAQDLVETCQANARKALSSASVTGKDGVVIVQEMVDCVQQGVARRLEQVNEEIAFQASIRTDIAAKLENYTCIDHTLESSPDVTSKTWRHASVEDIDRVVHIKHERPASKIHVIENFIDDEECLAMENAAKPTLHKATVADGKGGSRLSDSRKAMQAGIKVPWEKEQEGDAIARLSRRVYDYANDVLGLNIKHNGQEDLMSIQYFGRGANDTAPDRYTPHCDGDCTGLPHKEGQRMATMVMYCDVADQGGHTNFRNAGVHVKPERGSAVFFSYIDPKEMKMDTGFTEHSGCPVFVGTKRIVTQWIRYGVDDENPWNSFNTLGVKLSDLDEDGNAIENDDEEDEEEDDEETEEGEDTTEDEEL